MTLDGLIARLQKLRDKHGGRVTASINADDLNTGNGTFQIVNVQDVTFDHVRQVDGDGFQEYLADGTEKTKRCIILS